jgi:HSP20 family protein
LLSFQGDWGDQTQGETPMTQREMTPWTGGRGLTPLVRDPFTAFRQQVDRLFDDAFRPLEARSFGEAAAGAVWPNLDVDETDKAYVVTAELPGLEQKDVELTLRDNALILSGEKRQEHREENGGRTYAERSYGRFQRAIPLDSEVDADKVEARFKNGVLTVNLPKNAKAQDKTRRIEIRS